MAEVAKKDTFSDPWVADETRLLIGKGAAHQSLNLKYANRHGLIAGATGTGKTVTLQVLAEGFSRAGVPVFVADIKGDLSGISQAGKPHPKVDERVEKIGITDFTFNPTPTICWDVYGEQGHPIRITISEMGPLLLSRLMDLSDAQTGVLNIAFAYADDEGMLLLDLKDLRSLLTFIGENAKEISTTYGLVSTSSVGAIQRRLLELEQQGAEQFFGEPALKIEDIMRTDANGQGYINLLAADKLVNSPKLYSTFLLWLLSELFETLPEVGDPDKPTLVFFFDEAHLLFDEAPKVLIDKVEQVVRLIRSKGVGVYFITQSPQDVPVEVLGQLGNKIQHALRAFTPKDKKAVKVAAESFRENPELDTVTAITELGVGEALVSTLQKDGIPSVVDRTLIRPPCSRIGPASKGERIDILDTSPLKGTYDQTVDRESAYEVLNKHTTEMAKQAEQKQKEEQLERERRTQEKENSRPSEWERMGVSLTKYMARYAVQTLGRRVVRGVLGSILK